MGGLSLEGTSGHFYPCTKASGTRRVTGLPSAEDLPRHSHPRGDTVRHFKRRSARRTWSGASYVIVVPTGPYLNTRIGQGVERQVAAGPGIQNACAARILTSTRPHTQDHHSWRCGAVDDGGNRIPRAPEPHSFPAARRQMHGAAPAITMHGCLIDPKRPHPLSPFSPPPPSSVAPHRRRRSTRSSLRSFQIRPGRESR